MPFPLRTLRPFLITLLIVLVWAGLAGTALAREHTVREGQTLARIARRYRVSVQDLRAANRLRSARLRPGQRLRIPAEGEIFVRAGETLSHVARRVRISTEELRRTNRLRRGRTLRVGQRLLMPGYSPEERADRDFGDPEVPGRVTFVRRGERVQLQLVDDEGRVREEVLLALGAMMRRHDDDEAAAPNPRLALLLARLSDHFGGRPIQIVSGYRQAGGYTRETSRHTHGRATDIRIRGVPNRTLWEVCRRINHAGCGYYPGSTFVHVDARLRRTQWVDWSRPGQRPRYGTLRGPARRRQRLRMARPRVQSDLPLEIILVSANGETRSFEDSNAVDDAEAIEAAEESTEESAESTGAEGQEPDANAGGANIEARQETAEPREHALPTFDDKDPASRPLPVTRD